MSKHTALITGASRGIGYELAKQFAKNEYEVILVARNADKLKEIADDFHFQFKTTVHILPLNLVKPDAPNELYHFLKRNNIKVDYLVNNAGIGMHGYFHQIELNDNLDLLQLNITTLTHITRLFLSDMVTRNFGGVLNVASTAAFHPGPMMATYHASKAYVVSFTEALAAEMKGKKVKISVLCPGPTETNFHRRPGVENVFHAKRGMFTMNIEKVAKLGYNGLMNNKTVVIAGLVNTVAASMAKITPNRLLNPIVRSLHKK